MELSTQDKQNLLGFLDRVTTQGVQEAEAYLGLVRKLRNSLQDTEEE